MSALVVMLATTAEDAAMGLGLQLGAVIVVIGLAAAVLAFVRKRLRKASPMISEVGFSLDDLRQLRDRGELSPEEFDALRRTLLAVGGETRRADARHRADKQFQRRQDS